MKISKVIYVILLQTLLLASCLPNGEPMIMTGNQVKATQAELERAQERAKDREAYQVWDDYAMEVAKVYVLYTVELNEMMETEATSPAQYRRQMGKLVARLWEAREIPVPKNCPKCEDLNFALIMLIANKEWLIEHVDDPYMSDKAWGDRVNETIDAMDRLAWVLES